ncbi:TIGR02253 family HAD-type hydrolase [bacterium]|nr:TIGR02253 family HAD-type hydrolase [bacterium]MBU1652095.1 TIGR02253 family HAD-type hydrolase [bacterium]
MNRSKIQALLFDIDNTLVDFMVMKRSSVDAAIIAMMDAGLDLPYADAHQRIWAIYDREGIEDQEVFDRFILEHYGRLEYKILASAIIAYRRAREASLVLYPHVRATLLELSRKGYRLAVISDAPAKQAWLRLCALGIQHYFEAVITYEDTGERKPHPLPFTRALETLNLFADQAVMIGDWLERDIKGAKEVGLHTIYAHYGCCHPDTDNEKKYADFTIEDISEIISILDQNF